MSNQRFSRYLVLALLFAALAIFAVPGTAAAATVRPTYDLDGLAVFRFTDRRGEGFKLVTNFRDLAPTFDRRNGEFSFDFSNLPGQFYDLSSGDRIGRARVDLNLGMEGLTVSRDEVTGTQVKLIGREGSSTDGKISFDRIRLNGQTPVHTSRTIRLEEKFASVTSNSRERVQERYEPLVDSGAFSIVAGRDFRFPTNGLITNLHTWLQLHGDRSRQTVNLFGREYRVQGDVHARLRRNNAEVPEPATLALLGVALGGAWPEEETANVAKKKPPLLIERDGNLQRGQATTNKVDKGHSQLCLITLRVPLLLEGLSDRK